MPTKEVPPSLLEAHNIALSFNYELFTNLSFSLEWGKSAAILGVSGSGKSTLLYILSSLLKPDSGQVKLFNQDLYGLKQKEILKLRREDIGIIFQQHYLFKGFSAQENLELSALLSNEKIDESLLELFNIKRLMHKKVTELSGGEQQRVSIARVLIKKPRIIFADEPTGNLDKKTANDVMQRVFEYIKESNAGLFLVTHDEKLAHECDSVYRVLDKALLKLQ